MKTICWNASLIVKAENEQDAQWLTTFFEDLDNRDLFSGQIELHIGQFDSDGKLELYTEYYNLEDLKKNKTKGYVFVETDSKEHSGHEGQIVGFNFCYLNDWTNSYWKKLLEKELKK